MDTWLGRADGVDYKHKPYDKSDVDGAEYANRT